MLLHLILILKSFLPKRNLAFRYDIVALSLTRKILLKHQPPENVFAALYIDSLHGGRHQIMPGFCKLSCPTLDVGPGLRRFAASHFSERVSQDRQAQGRERRSVLLPQERRGSSGRQPLYSLLPHRPKREGVIGAALCYTSASHSLSPAALLPPVGRGKDRRCGRQVGAAGLLRHVGRRRQFAQLTRGPLGLPCALLEPLPLDPHLLDKGRDVGVGGCHDHQGQEDGLLLHGGPEPVLGPQGVIGPAYGRPHANVHALRHELQHGPLGDPPRLRSG
ncbi:integrase-like protein [Frog virus 3]|uniref:Integrase-like protein n=1 Tax=Frog virus 3 TaxID=10493 RepID=A0A2U7M3M0_FRG3V|nr:putative integrase-like protein [Frog virus 3]ASU44161.1 putative integrase-like protein [Rana catesbeiana virus 2]QKO01758.1 integrase-like protein [Frog virus 3]